MCNQVPCIFPRTVFFHLYHYNNKHLKILWTALELNVEDTPLTKNVSLLKVFPLRLFLRVGCSERIALKQVYYQG